MEVVCVCEVFDFEDEVGYVVGWDGIAFGDGKEGEYDAVAGVFAVGVEVGRGFNELWSWYVLFKWRRWGFLGVRRFDDADFGCAFGFGWAVFTFTFVGDVNLVVLSVTLRGCFDRG